MDNEPHGRSIPLSPVGQSGVGDIKPPASPRRGEESWVPGGARTEARARQPHRAGVFGFRGRARRREATSPPD